MKTFILPLTFVFANFLGAVISVSSNLTKEGSLLCMIWVSIFWLGLFYLGGLE